MSSSHTPQLDLGPTLGALLNGVVLGAMFLGITSLQVAFYYRAYTKDSVWMKVFVGVLCVLDMLSLVLWGHAGYTYLVTNYGNLAVADTLVWSVAGEPPITGLIALSVHLFLAWRIQICGGFSPLLSIVLCLVFDGPKVASINHRSSMSTVLRHVEWYTLAGDLSASVIDVTIAGSIMYLVYHGQSDLSSTNRMLAKLALYIVASGAITSITRVLDLVLSRVYPNTLYFLIPYISSSKVYTNALLATLNSRPRRRDLFASGSDAAVELRNALMDPVKARSAFDELPKVVV